MADQAPMKDWMKLIPEAELAVYRHAGFMHGVTFGERAALIVVDVTLGFTGLPGLTLEQAMVDFPTACGPASWQAMPHIARLIAMFRERNLPVIFTGNDVTANIYTGKATKGARKGKPNPRFNEFPQEIAPREDEWVLMKTKASGFFQTALATYLVRERIDTAVVCGISTSGCVRATAVDAFSNGFSTFVVEECCSDRSHFAHCTNLFDLNAKYAAVLSLDELEALMGPVRRSNAA
jgi:nicotinamidase-related amidase